MRASIVGLWVVGLVLVGCSSDEPGGSGDASDAPSTTARPADPTNCGGAEVAAGVERTVLTFDGVDREVARSIPEGYDGSTPAPLVVDLHGFSSNIDQQTLFSDLPAQAGARGHVVVTPQAAPATVTVAGEPMTAPLWNLGATGSEGLAGAQDDAGFLTELVDRTIEELCIDTSRVYVTGNSNGAGMSTLLACELGGRLAAIAPVSGINLAPPCDDLAATPVIAFHGDADPLVPYDGGDTASTGADVRSVPDAVAAFATAGSCGPEPDVARPHDDVELRRWTGCAPGVDVELHTVLGGGHTWPGMLNYVDAARLAELGASQEFVQRAGLDLGAVAGHMTVNIEATDLMLDFFDAHRLQ